MPRCVCLFQAVAIISVSFVLLSTIALMLNSMESIRDVEIRTIYNYTATADSNVTSQVPFKTETHSVDNHVLTYIDYVCIAWFTGEYIVRLWASPDRCAFAKSPMNVIDVLAFMPFYITLMLSFFEFNAESFDGLRRVIQTFRVMRVLRVLKLARHSTGLQVRN